jgi:hypothetical protein
MAAGASDQNLSIAFTSAASTNTESPDLERPTLRVRGSRVEERAHLPRHPWTVARVVPSPNVDLPGDAPGVPQHGAAVYHRVSHGGGVRSCRVGPLRTISRGRPQRARLAGEDA